MVMTRQQLRPTTASLIVSVIATAEGEDGLFCEICCIRPDEAFENFNELCMTIMNKFTP